MVVCHIVPRFNEVTQCGYLSHDGTVYCSHQVCLLSHDDMVYCSHKVSFLPHGLLKQPGAVIYHSGVVCCSRHKAF